MQKYDVVLLVDAKLSDAERKTLLADMEKSLGKAVLEKDDMGVQSLAYNLSDKIWQNTAYMVSYYVQAPAADITAFKKDLVYNKSIKRYVVYKMNATEPFFTFAALNKELTTIIDGRDQKKIWQKLTFLADRRNAKYLNWKAIPLLKKYISRFGNIKPRKYTGNSVGLQKKLRETVLRARELGLLEYAKD